MDNRDFFFHLADVEIVDQVCQGTACFVARHRDPARWTRAVSSEPRVFCLGKCYLGPAAATDVTPPRVEVDAPEAVLLGHVATGGRYTALEWAVGMSRDALVGEIDRSGLRGRGGAAFPTGRKWRAVAAEGADTKFVVCNADEGDPGAFSDRVLLERDPHRVLEGTIIAALAVGAARGFVYVRKEYPEARDAMERAVAEARTAGVLGDSVLGVAPPFEVEVVSGEGSYVCGEETALLNALEGRRPEVRARPPYPSERGLFGRPTLVHNVETLATVPWIVTNGGDAYAGLGTGQSRGTKLVSLNSLFRRPGVYEVELGITIREIVERLGGGLTDGEMRGLLVGGPLAGVLPPELLDTPFDFEALRAVGCDVGHGGMVAFDEHTSVPELVHHVFAFGAYESCGKCTPCREGAPRIEALFDPDAGGVPRHGDAQEVRDLVAALGMTSLCGHGTGLAAFAASVMSRYGNEIDQWLG